MCAGALRRSIRIPVYWGGILVDGSLLTIRVVYRLLGYLAFLGLVTVIVGFYLCAIALRSERRGPK
jgi:hypothetical protein